MDRKMCEVAVGICGKSSSKNFSLQKMNEEFLENLTSGKHRRSIEIAKWTTPNELYKYIKTWVKKIQEVSVPHTYVAEAVALHLKKVCKDELKTVMGVPQQRENEALTMLNITKLRIPRSRHITNESMISSGDDGGSEHADTSRIEYQMSIKEAMEEFSNELDSTLDNICNQALDHIHTNEFILTMGYSHTLQEFFKNAARKRKFNLIIAECSPYNKGHFLAEKLSTHSNIDITIIPDSTIFAVMSRVNKVIINSYAVGVNGNLCAPAGSHSLALAAHTHSVPLLVCCGLYKLVPRFSMISPSSGVDYDGHLPQNPTHILDYSCAGIYRNNVTIINPTFDDVPGELVTLFITNIGAQAPNYIYRLMSDMYGEGFNLYPKKLV